jgi:signal transduction protein with GAF and PtsI domain
MHPDTRALDDALRAIIARFAAETGTIHVLRGETLELAALHGDYPPPVRAVIERIPVGKGMAGVCAELNEPVTWCNLNRDSSGVVQPAARSTGLAGSIVVPVRDGSARDGGVMVGTLGIANRGERTFTDAETAVLVACAASLARFRVR